MHGSGRSGRRWDLGRSPRDDALFHDVYYTRFTRLENGEVESWELYITVLDWHLSSGDNLHGM